MFARAYLGWKPPKVIEQKAAKLPSYEEVMAEFDKRMELMTRPRQLEKPTGPSAVDVFAEAERRINQVVDGRRADGER